MNFIEYNIPCPTCGKIWTIYRSCNIWCDDHPFRVELIKHLMYGNPESDEATDYTILPVK